MPGNAWKAFGLPLEAAACSRSSLVRSPRTWHHPCLPHEAATVPCVMHNCKVPHGTRCLATVAEWRLSAGLLTH